MVVSAVSIAEALTDSFIDSLAASSPVNDSQFGRQLLARAADSFHQTWPDRNSWLNAGFGVSIAGERAGQEFDLLVEVRNALVHGQGSLTDRQTRRTSEAIALQRRIESVLKAQVAGRRILLGPTAGPLALGITRTFVVALDHAVAAARLRLRPIT